MAAGCGRLQTANWVVPGRSRPHGPHLCASRCSMQSMGLPLK